MRVLFLGNSQFAQWGIPAMLQDLSAAGVAIDCEASLIGGAWLQTHLDSPESLGMLDAGGWDKVILQELYIAPNNPEARHSFHTAGGILIDRVKAHAAVPIFYASPNVEETGDEGFMAIHDLTAEFAREREVGLAAAGAACLKAREKIPGLDLHDTDRRHPNFVASYIGACSLYAALTGESPIGLPSTCGGGEVPPNQAPILQAAAWQQHHETIQGA